MTVLDIRAVKAVKSWLNKSDSIVQVTWSNIIFALHSWVNTVACM
jgi:hypothetical protein